MSTMWGLNGAGKRVPINAEDSNDLGVAIASPKNPFGSIWAENQTPIFQSDAVYGINTVNILTTTSSGGTATASDSLFVCSTGTNSGGMGTIQSRKRLRYRAGQGIVSRFTGMFTTPVASSFQLLGLGHSEDGVFVGYKGTSFGIVYNTRGKREIQTLTITTKSSTAENAVVTLNGTAHNVAVTNGASTITTAYELAQGTYPGWKAESVGSTVVFVSDSVGNKSGAFTLSGTTVVGAFAETQAGQDVTETFIAQTSFNGDTVDGKGPSGFTANWTKLNIFQIHIQYLGAGSITVQMMATYTNAAPKWITVHTIRNPNTLTTSNFGNPSFPFTMTAYSTGSTTNLTVKCASFAGFVEGQKLMHGPRISHFGTSTSVGNAAYHVLDTIRNNRVYNGRTNQSVVNLLSIAVAVKHSQPVTLYLIRNATLVGSPNFAQYSTNSVTYVDTAATTCTFSSNEQVVWSVPIAETGGVAFAFTDETTLQPGETLTVCARATTATASYVSFSLNTREDQ